MEDATVYLGGRYYDDVRCLKHNGVHYYPPYDNPIKWVQHNYSFVKIFNEKTNVEIFLPIEQTKISAGQCWA
jgi:hypothetical protein